MQILLNNIVKIHENAISYQQQAFLAFPILQQLCFIKFTIGYNATYNPDIINGKKVNALVSGRL